MDNISKTDYNVDPNKFDIFNLNFYGLSMFFLAGD